MFGTCCSRRAKCRDFLIIIPWNQIKIFESHYYPTNIEQFKVTENYLIFSGIGNPESFKETLVKNKLNIIKEINFPDHFDYTQADINKIKFEAKNLNAKIITTEKDYSRIENYNIPQKENIKSVKIELKVKNEIELIDFLKKYIWN